MTPLHRRTATRVWLARDPGLSPLDPLEAALATMADVVVNERLPASADELGGYDRLVVASRTPAAAGLTAADVARAQGLRPGGVPTLWPCPDGSVSSVGSAGPARPEPWSVSLDRLATFLSKGAATIGAAA